MLTFDNSPPVYWFIGYALAAFVVFSAFFKPIPTKIYLASAILLLIIMRLPVIVFNRELNPDESQMLSHAITFFKDPVYWRSVDGTTIGPLDNYLLAIPRLLGFQINYTSGRIMGLLCSGGALLLLFYSLKNWFGAAIARKISVVPILFLAFTQEVDFVHYSSEQLPVLLLAVCVWCLSKATSNLGNLKSDLYFLGLAAGTIPFAKLQAVPQALVLAVAGLWVGFQYFKSKKESKPLIFLILGGLTFPLLMLIWTLAFNVFSDLIEFYILGNAIYADGKGFFEIPGQFLRIFRLTTDFQIFTLALIVPIICAFYQIFRKPNADKTNLVIPVTILLLLFSSIYAVTKSGNDFIHYLNFCIIPWTLMAGYGLSRIEKWSVAFPAVVLIWFASNDAYHFIKERRLNAFDSVNARTLAQSPVVLELKKYSQPDDYMVVWGWQCVYYVEAQLAQGTAENHSERSIFSHPMQEKYKSRYLSDIERNKPAIVLDAVGKNSMWVQNKKAQGIESYPALFQYILNNYKLIGDFDDTRLYVRKDRL
ncbi:hypothetical protein MUK70_24420 [Dyadobacter chenwenxiniae]|uniref:Uncharacterized protein n=1 Tax=Dyadobacter chenwenxiniae TaxID=2906456 RepID=A0A9X1TGD2_9BACT|nr:hypothetical protein [Dyadobacter chenwenxiniae]MCF0065411.1 hypothetical protein [Dyadobacter chenwenxiniae]UON82178.1 hypothetical protein MUK70_24420 [Dyadobacter chenwenxiniae]